MKSRTLITVFLIWLYSLSISGASELYKVPMLFRHFTEHLSWNRSETVIQFLITHYLEDTTRNGDAQKDSELPFKSVKNYTATIVTGIVPPSKLRLPQPALQEQRNPFFSVYRMIIGYDPCASIFHPPDSA